MKESAMDIKFSMALLEPLSQLFHICYQSKVNWTLLLSLTLLLCEQFQISCRRLLSFD